MKTKVIARFHDDKGHQYNLRASADESLGEVERYDTNGRDYVYSGAVSGAIAKFQELGNGFMDDIQAEKLAIFLANRAPVISPPPPPAPEPDDFTEEGV